MGLQQATLCTWEAIKKFNPDLIITAGTAGGLEEMGADIGDIYVSTHKIWFF